MKLFAIIFAATLLAGAILLAMQDSAAKKQQTSARLGKNVAALVVVIEAATVDYETTPTPAKRASLERDVNLMRLFAASQDLPDNIRARCAGVADDAAKALTKH